jgi:hypothetical protein
MDEPLSKAEIGKDAIQSAAEAAATTVGEVTTIITRAVREVATVLGDFATEVFEIRDSSRRASAEIEGESDVDAEPQPDLGSTPPHDLQVDEE